MNNITNRRRAERIRLPEPIDARFAGSDVTIADIGLLGARLAHDKPLAQTKDGLLEFNWGGSSVAIKCTVARAGPAEQGFDTGLEFVEAIGNSATVLRELIYLHVSRVIAEQRANARGERTIFDDDARPFLQESGEEKSARYISYRLDGTKWQTIATSVVKQPTDGFTVAESTPEAEVTMLKESYEGADDETRAMIRAMAELSITRGERSLPSRRLKK